MSKSTNQSLTLLAAIGGCMYEIKRKNMLPAPEDNEFAWSTYLQVIGIMEAWPETGDSAKNKRWIYGKFDEWHRLFRQDDTFYPTTLTAIAEQCLADLRTVVKSPHKVKMLDSLVEPVGKIHSILDPAGSNFQAYEEASRLMLVLYGLIEWEW